MKQIEPVRRVNLTTRVMESIKDYISSNNLGPGDRLPSEKVLTSSLNVSRNILREALKSLEAVGLIEIKVGDGMYVSSLDYSSMVDHISFAILRNDPALDHFIQARLIIEVGLMDLVVRNLDEVSLLQLEECNRRISEAGTLEEFSELDLDFHRQLLEIADNPILSEFGAFLGRFFQRAQRLVGMDARDRTAAGHRELLAALRARDVEAAKDVMRRHIHTWDAELEKNGGHPAQGNGSSAR
jgi:GntR family transcriptional repressor for pyruvate dehydrogenase complex